MSQALEKLNKLINEIMVAHIAGLTTMNGEEIRYDCYGLIGNAEKGTVKGYRGDILLHEAEYDNGTHNGLVKQYYANGVLRVVSEYKNGKSNGIETQYDINGKPIWEREYKDGQLINLRNLGKENK